MIDNVRGFNVGGDAHHRLEEMYKWARECAVKYDCVILATSQISAEGDGQQFPTLGMLKDSKTGKQGACDFQLMIGAVNDSNLEGVRWLSLPKNKLRREGASGDPKAEVRYLPQIARYKDTPLGV
jgi:replicative DNA helicase